MKNSTINTMIYSDEFSCWQPNCYTAWEEMLSIAYEMTKALKSKRGRKKRGEYDVHSKDLLPILTDHWFTTFEEWWKWRKKKVGIEGEITFTLKGSWSPDEYNYRPDAAKIGVTVDATAKSWLLWFADKHKDHFHQFLKYAHGPRDGYRPAPGTPVTYGHWLEVFTHLERPKNREWAEHTTAYILDFVLFGQKDGKFSEEILDELTNEFKVDFWDENYLDVHLELENKIYFVPEKPLALMQHV